MGNFLLHAEVPGLIPFDPRLAILRASSDHPIVDAAANIIQVGDDVVFASNYSVLPAVMTSP